jgi:membrane protease YdiL (CAAX protease family)
MVIGARNQSTRGKLAAPVFFFDGVCLSKWVGISLSMGLLSAVVLTASELNVSPERTFSLFDFVQNFFVYAACTLTGLIFAERSFVETFLLVAKKSWLQKAGLLLGYGGLTGVAMGLAYHQAFAAYRFSPRVPFRVRHMKTNYDNFILSLSAAITEEVVFRLLLFTGFWYVLERLFRPLMSVNPGLSRPIPLLFSLVLSSLLFGTVHGAYGFLFAFVAGTVLCLVFLRGGLESAMLAHFLTNVIFFRLTYLS